MIHIYTSQSKRYFEHIGKYCLASILKYLPPDTKITVTTEDYADFPRLDPRIEVLDLYALNNGFKRFEDHWTGKTMAKVIAFAKKGYTVLHACETVDRNDTMVWLDADAHFKMPVDEAWCKRILANNLAAHLGVMHDDGEFTIESGFFMMNPAHAGFDDFARIYRDYYDNDRCEGMGRFYDSNVQGHVAQDCEKLGHTFTEMNLRKKGNTPIRGSMVEAQVGHYKGKVKHDADHHYQQYGLDEYVAKVLA